MASRSAALLLLVATTAICAAVLVPRAEARLDTGTARFSSCGGAESCLGKARLRRILKRSHWHHRKSAEELAQQLDKDGDLVVDEKSNTLAFRCSGLIPPQLKESLAAGAADDVEATAVAASSTADQPTEFALPLATDMGMTWTPDMPDAAITQAQAFSLHSRPSATKKILLDFDGHVTTKSAWNNAFQKDPIITPAYDKDNNPSSWSAAELGDILAIWRAVAEDFAPWDVDVTTQDPGAAYIGANGVRVAIGGTSNDWLGGGGEGGVAYGFGFGQYNGYYGPAFVFAKSLGTFAKYVWEAVSHEVGHTLGLSHDDTTSSPGGYYLGDASSSYAWAPIMGNAVYASVSQWSKGEYANAGNKEDDIAIISKSLGDVFSWPQPVGNSTATATPLTVKSSGSGTATANGYGVIRAPNDVDMFKVTTTAAGTITLTVAVPPPNGIVPNTKQPANRANLNAAIKVTDSRNVVLTTASGMGLSTQLTVPAAGTYYISVASSGRGSPSVGGFSTYDSRGQYMVSATYPSTSAPAPPPASPVMTVSSITNTKSVSSTQVNCVARVTVVNSATRAALPNVAVSASWSSVLNTTSGWPFAAAATTGSTGVATFTSKALPATPGNGCLFRVTGLQLSGYSVASNYPSTAPTVTW